MKRTTIMLPDELKTKALNHAKMMGLSLAGFIRASLEQAMQSRAQPLDDPFFADTAVFGGQSPDDLAEKHDDYLYGNPS